MSTVERVRTLTDFLLARIAEDEERAWRAHDVACPDLHWYQHFGKPHRAVECDGCEVPTRVLAECEAKRRIVHEFKTFTAARDTVGEGTPLPQALTTAGILTGIERALGHLSMPFAGHPDYDASWKP